MSGTSNKRLMLDALATKISLLSAARMLEYQISSLGGNWLSYADSQRGSFNQQYSPFLCKVVCSLKS